MAAQCFAKSRFLRWILITLGLFGSLLFLAVCAAYFLPELYRIESDEANLGTGRTALLLGTSKYLVSGGENPYYRARVDTAARLYKEGVLKKIIASGDSGDDYYNEPRDMRADLISLGVSPKDIFPDGSGTRTLNSVRRCSEIFKEDSPVIISQNFQLKRALMLADALGVKADAFAAPDPDGLVFRIRNGTREIFARILALYEVLEMKL